MSSVRITKKFRIMKKEYLSPEMQVVKFAMSANIIAASYIGGGEGSGESATKEYNDVSNDNTTNGSNIWDKEW